LFTVGTRSFDQLDVIAAAVLRGDWTDLADQIRQGLACVKQARLSEDGLPRIDLEQAACEFRYARNLITVEETEAWLERFGLGFDEWTEFLDRSARRAAWARDLEMIVPRHHVSESEVATCIRVDAICSGKLARFAEVLAGRAAVCDPGAPGGTEPAEDVDASLVESVRRQCAAVLSRDSTPSSGDWKTRIADLERMERNFQTVARDAITTEAVQSQIATHRINWIRVHCRTLSLPTLDMAREATLCVRSEGESLQEVAARARTAIRRERLFLDQLDPQRRAAVLSAQPDDLLGPFASEGGFMITLVEEKIVPDEKDPDVQRLAREEILAALVADRMTNVRWHARL
jgi:hypothetical protein